MKILKDTTKYTGKPIKSIAKTINKLDNKERAIKIKEELNKGIQKRL